MNMNTQIWFKILCSEAASNFMWKISFNTSSTLFSRPWRSRTSGPALMSATPAPSYINYSQRQNTEANNKITMCIFRCTQVNDTRPAPCSLGWKTTQTHCVVTHLQNVVAADGECFQVSQMFHDLWCHNSIKPSLALLLLLLLSFIWKLLQGAGLVRHLVTKVWVWRRMQLGNADAFFNWIYSQHAGSQAAQWLGRQKERWVDRLHEC